MVFEEGLSGITLSVDRLEEALLTPDSREEGEVDSDGELSSESEGACKQQPEREEVQLTQHDKWAFYCDICSLSNPLFDTMFVVVGSEEL